MDKGEPLSEQDITQPDTSPQDTSPHDTLVFFLERQKLHLDIKLIALGRSLYTRDFHGQAHTILVDATFPAICCGETSIQVCERVAVCADCLGMVVAGYTFERDRSIRAMYWKYLALRTELCLDILVDIFTRLMFPRLILP